MNNKQIDELDDLTLYLYFDLAILKSAVKDSENLEIYVLEKFIERIYKCSEKIRNIFDNEII